ncbi:hypothetical protein [Azospirillum doebereinerae]|uniref:hypothetical protein n=1 Tax=Azospirillum doebereinerae TaxID=92933 RepID=UPI000F8EBAF3|nr:hypothetical protein [Azospirillum doebereinerae]MCG5240569.1 hypothetical protein [Azospirillum doebereinerae]
MAAGNIGLTRGGTGLRLTRVDPRRPDPAARKAAGSDRKPSLAAMNRPQHPHLKLAVDNASAPGVPPGAARPIPEDYGLTAADLRIWYAPGRAGVAVALLVAAVAALSQAIEGARFSQPWILGALSGLLYGAFIGGLAGLGAMVMILWADPLVARLWPTYGRLRRYREALASARQVEDGRSEG